MVQPEAQRGIDKMPDSGTGGRGVRRREVPALLSLIDVAGASEESVLPPGRRDASGFWYPASCRSPMELFSAYQRSLQEKQRSVHRARRRRASASTHVAMSAGDDAGDCDRTVPLPAPCPEAPVR